MFFPFLDFLQFHFFHYFRKNRIDLFEAVSIGDTDTVSGLITYGHANIEATGFWDYTPLHQAARWGRTETVRVLINKFRANLEAINRFGETPLHLAASFDHAETVYVLINEFHANVNAVNNNAVTPIVLAFEKGHDNIVWLLEQLGAQLPAHLRKQPQIIAPISCYVNPIQEKLPDALNNPFQEVIFSYLPNKDLANLSASCKQLYSWSGEERKKRSLTQLLLAVVQGNEREAKRLIALNPFLLQSKAGVVTDYSNRKIEELTPFQAALCAGDVEMCEMMKPYFPKPEDGQPTLIESQFNDIFPQGIEAHVEKQKKDVFDFTPILIAIKSASNDEVQIALDKNFEKDTPLNQALKAFRKQFHDKSLSEKIYNLLHLIRAFKVYETQHINLITPEKRDLFWRQVVGFVQRYLPACYAQAFANGLAMMDMMHKSLVRAFKFEFVLDKGRAIFPLVSDGGLGYDWTLVCKAYAAKSAPFTALGLVPHCCILEKIMSNVNIKLARITHTDSAVPALSLEPN